MRVTIYQDSTDDHIDLHHRYLSKKSFNGPESMSQTYLNNKCACSSCSLRRHEENDSASATICGDLP
jgi:hypothetical protein